MITLLRIGNHMDVSAIEEKNAWQQESCKKRNRVLFELL